MEDPAEQLIRRALGRRPPPTLGATLADDVLRRLAARHPPADAGWRSARRWLPVPWLLAAGASVAVLAHVEWPSAAKALAWGLALVTVPLGYAAALWPGRVPGLLALCGAPLLGEPKEASPAVSPGSPAGRRRGSSASPR